MLSDCLGYERRTHKCTRNGWVGAGMWWVQESEKYGSWIHFSLQPLAFDGLCFHPSFSYIFIYSIFAKYVQALLKSMQHANKNEKIIALVHFCLHSSASIFVIACIYLGESMHTSGLTVIFAKVF